MSQKYSLKNLVVQATKVYSETNYQFLEESIYSEPISHENQLKYVQLLNFARSLQRDNPAYESAYRHLLNLFVLNGSRISALKSIHRRLRTLETEHGSLVLISGVSGIGKTSLAMAFQEMTQQMGATFLVCRCLEQESNSYALWQRVARSIASVSGVSHDSLSAPIGEGAQAKSYQHLNDEFTNWLNGTASYPFVTLLDDLHWADKDSLQLLDSLTNQSILAPIMFIATYRSEEVQPGHALYEYLPKFQRNRPFDLIQLNPLNQDDITRLVTAYHGRCSPQLAAYLQARAEGHPLFTIELLNDLIEQGLLAQDHDGFWLPPAESVPVPKILQHLIAQRVSRLGNQVEKLLLVAAVVGEIWQLEIVEQLLDMSEADLLDALEIALRAEIIAIENEEAEIYRFAHALIKEVLYTQQIARRRKRLHEQVAFHFEALLPSNIYSIAYHFYAAGNWEKAIHYSIEAGEQAFTRFAGHSALQLYQQALNAAERTDNPVTPAVHAEIYERLGRTYKTLALREDAENAYSRMRAIAQSMGDVALEGRALSQLAQLQVNLYKSDLAERSSREVLQLAEQTGNAELLAQGHLSLGKILLVGGSLKSATEHLMKSIRHAKEMDDPVTMSESFRYLAYMAIWMGQYQEATSYAQQAYENARHANDPLLLAGGYQILSYVQIEVGQYVKAYDNIRPMLKVGDISDTHHHQLPRMLNQMGYLYLELGDASEALYWDLQALESAQTTRGPNNLGLTQTSKKRIGTIN